MRRSEPLGLPSGRVVVVPYDPRWPSLFEISAKELRSVLGGSALEIHHVGSTAIAGMSAKPILDVLVTIRSFEGGRLLMEPLGRLGYEYRPDEDIPDRHYFRRGPASGRTHHLSLAEGDSRHAMATLAFRDALRTDADLARAYEQLKLDLARRYPGDREAYLEGKSEFVRRVLEGRGLVIEDG